MYYSNIQILNLCLLPLQSLGKFFDKRKKISSLHVWSKYVWNDQTLRSLIILYNIRMAYHPPFQSDNFLLDNREHVVQQLVFHSACERKLCVFGPST